MMTSSRKGCFLDSYGNQKLNSGKLDPFARNGTIAIEAQMDVQFGLVLK